LRATLALLSPPEVVAKSRCDEVRRDRLSNERSAKSASIPACQRRGIVQCSQVECSCAVFINFFGGCTIDHTSRFESIPEFLIAEIGK